MFYLDASPQSESQLLLPLHVYSFISCSCFSSALHCFGFCASVLRAPWRRRFGRSHPGLGCIRIVAPMMRTPSIFVTKGPPGMIFRTLVRLADRPWLWMISQHWTCLRAMTFRARRGLCLPRSPRFPITQKRHRCPVKPSPGQPGWLKASASTASSGSDRAPCPATASTLRPGAAYWDIAKRGD